MSQTGTQLAEEVKQPVIQLATKPFRDTVLAYHEITSQDSEYRYAVSSRTLEEHLKLGARLGNAPGFRSRLQFSFDDGHISNYFLALPLLEKYSTKAVFFVIVGRVGQSGFMTWAQLRELVARGHQVCAHGWSHKMLTRCSDAELRSELGLSRNELENKLGVSVAALSAPHGRWNRRVALACAQAGYRRLYTSTPWALTPKLGDMDILGRLMVIRSMNEIRLFNWLTMGRARAGMIQAGYAFKQSLRYVLGNTLYHRLWVTFAGSDGYESEEIAGR